jgi:hypothetical protein
LNFRKYLKFRVLLLMAFLALMMLGVKEDYLIVQDLVRIVCTSCIGL